MRPVKNQALYDADIRALRHDDGKKQLTDGRALYLLVRWLGTTARHSWRLDYKRPTGKRNTLVIGSYPEIGLALARERAQDARNLLAVGKDPAVERNEAAAAVIAKAQAQAKATELADAGKAPEGTFEYVWQDYIAHRHGTKSWSANYERTFRSELGRTVLPRFKDRQLHSITPREFMTLLRELMQAGEIARAHRVQTMCGKVWAWGMKYEYCDINVPTALGKVIDGVQQGNRGHLPALLEPDAIRELLKDIGHYGHESIRRCMQVCTLVWQRPGNVMNMEWSEVDLDGAMWVIPSWKLKRKTMSKAKGKPHHVPLAKQAVAILRDQHAVTGAGQYVFSTDGGANDLNKSALIEALERMGYQNKHCPHGFRAMGRTLCEEVLGYDGAILEAHLAHKPPAKMMGAAYMRATFVEKRKEVMQAWADHLDAIRRSDIKLAA